MRIRTKIIVAFLLISLVSGVTGYFGLESVTKVNHSFDVLHFQTVPLVDSLKNGKVAALSVAASTKDIISESDPGARPVRMDLITQEKSRFIAALNQCSELTSTYFPDQRPLVDDIMTRWATFESSSDNVISSAGEGAAYAKALDDFAESEKALLAALDRAIAAAEENVAIEEASFETSLSNANYSILVMILTSVSITLAIVVLVTFSLSKPLASLRQAIHEISKGNFDVKVELQRDDEMGALVTDFEKMKRDLKEKDRLKEEFINIAAHELRTPVLPIILTSEDLADEIDAGKSDKVNIILRNAKRLKKLTDDILDASRIESNTFKLNKSETSLVSLARNIASDAKSRVHAGQKVDITFQSELPENYAILLDQEKIRQVITNLLNNAIDFTDSGTIALGLQETGSSEKSVEVKVVDTGKGIDESVKDRLFQKFVTKSNKAKGTGLGLYLCKAIVEAHGGRIRGENNAGGKGATFAFTLPVDGLQYLPESGAPQALAADTPEYLKHHAE
jgi:signal transduction histidine kinase